jgi:hypothetical protein
LSSAVLSAVKTYDLGGKRLVKEDIIKLLDDHRVLLKAAFLRGGLRPLTQIAAIALRYSIQPHRSLPDDRIEVIDLNGETLFVVKGFSLDAWKYSWGSENETLTEEELEAVTDHDWQKSRDGKTEFELQKEEQVEQVQQYQQTWSRKKRAKSEKRLAIEAALQNGVTISELMKEYGHTRAYFWGIGKEIGLNFPSQRGKWNRKPKGERATDPVVGPAPGAKRVSRFDQSMDAMKPCSIPSEGWYCTRKAGHEGPCAAKPLSTYVPQGRCCDNGNFGDKHVCQKQPGRQIGTTGYADGRARMDAVADDTLEQLRAKRLTANAIKPSWRVRLGNIIRSVANRVEGSNA